MPKKILGNSISTKLLLSIIVVVLIPTTFISGFYFFSSSNIVKNNVRETSMQIATQAADSLSFIFTVGSDLSDLIYSNKEIQERMMMEKEAELDPKIKENNTKFITDYLNSQIYSSSFVRMIYILRSNTNSWGSGSFTQLKLLNQPFESTTWYKESLVKDGGIVWQGLQYDQYSGAADHGDLVLPISRVMKDFDTMENIGLIHVSMDGKTILKQIEQVKLGETGKFFVVNKLGKIMIDKDLDKINKTIKNTELFDVITDGNSPEFEFTHLDTKYYGVRKTLTNDWILIGIVPMEEITGGITNVQKITLITALIFTLIALVFGFIAAKRMTNPIKKLTKQMVQVGKGNFQTTTEIQSKDEIGILSKQFNQMIFQVDNLMEQVKLEESKKMEAELRALNYRINPHFLFNTLSTINWLVKLEQTEKASAALAALSKLLEASMGKNGTFVTLKEELDIVKKFLVILQIRYDQTFNLQISADDEVLEELIPRMLIQPIIENSVFHGIVPKGVSGEIKIKVQKCEDEGIKITITDDGIGFDSSKLNNLSLSSEKKVSFVGIGLTHVYESISLYFNPNSNMKIESNSNGTQTILILYPKNGDGRNV
ncbi:sensor histidine kinase [Lederbergia graminis]|uniref:Histidine kinase n=1 Tax=Lederbergia graminis TaxID=735518 RepID=A0ABW0LFJ5_9BACI